MSTAIAVYTSDGCVGRCDAKCHDAICADCDCVCGGRLHGVGRQNAIAQNTADLLGPALAWAERNGLDAQDVTDVLVHGLSAHVGEQLRLV